VPGPGGAASWQHSHSLTAVLMSSEPAGAPVAPFYIYTGPAFPSVDALLACRGVQRLAPFEEPQAQFYSEIGLWRSLATHPARVDDPTAAELFYVPVLPHLSSDAGTCNGSRHRGRMAAVAASLRSSPQWQRHNGTDHLWACACVMMKGMLGGELWELLSTAIHAVHSVPRGRASPSRCQISIPYYNPSFAAASEAWRWRVPGLPRPTLAHFRGRIMNRVRAQLVRSHAQPPNLIQAAHPSTAARCNLNKCSSKAKEKVGFPQQSVHFEEMRHSTFCLVPAGDSPPSSRLYLAIAAGCIPVFISDHFEGAFATSVPWATFSLRVAETDVLPSAAPTSVDGGRRLGKRRGPQGPPAVNLTAHLAAVAADTASLAALQRALQTHAPSVLWEAPGSRCGHHALALATHALRRVCLATQEAPIGAPAPSIRQPQVYFGRPA